METVYAECGDCGSTGLYQGFMEGKNAAVVCLACGGYGCQEIRYKPFEKRRRRRGVKTIRHSRALVATGKAMTYREFEELYPEGRSGARGR